MDICRELQRSRVGLRARIDGTVENVAAFEREVIQKWIIREVWMLNNIGLPGILLGVIVVVVIIVVARRSKGGGRKL